MATSIEQVLTRLLTQQNETQKATQQLLQNVMAEITTSRTANVAAPSNNLNREQLMDILSKQIQEFVHAPDEDHTFETWYTRYQDIFDEDAKQLNDADKTRLLLRKVSSAVYQQYAHTILPAKPNEIDFKSTVIKNDLEDYTTYIARVNRQCEKFQLNTCSSDNLKCLIFVSGLQATKDSVFRNEILKMLDEEKPSKPVTLNSVNSEIQRILQRQQDNKVIANTSSITHAVRTQVNQIRNQSKKDGTKSPPSPCWFCGGMHYARFCFYASHKCTQCGTMGHKEGYCNARKNSTFKGNKHQKDSSQTKQQQQIVKTQQANKSSKAIESAAQTRIITDFAQLRRHIEIFINGVKAQLQLDTASDCTIISENLWKNINMPTLYATKHTARDANCNKGEFFATITHQGETKSMKVLVTYVNELNIAGADFFEEFSLWDIPINSFCMKQNAVPKFCPKRPVPYSAITVVDAELNRLQDAGVITPTNYSDWGAPIVIVKRPNGKIRICADYSTGLNACVEPHFHPLPLPEDIFINLKGRKYFTRFDFNDAYMQFDVDEATKSILTINTHRGLYKFNRLVPLIKSAPGAFQQAIEKVLTGIQEATPYLDDVIVASNNFNQHVKSIRKVLQRLSEYNITVNYDKCEFFQSKIKYLGHVVDAEGIRPDRNKIMAIINLPRPSNK
ncbi:uncharacterized protein K02A2.6-like [Anastrepha ludens]|uniref:uncharacterized protein K02A2.6-like n=1 Tax=Anastrepha ludens TaxID=28586 RepID=UPI0023B1B0F1|nr:uncharacterized protein K02A2.6-like [Anastrepha ludens]